MNERLTLTEFFALFGKAKEQTRWLASVDSEEYLSVVLYLVERSKRR